MRRAQAWAITRLHPLPSFNLPLSTLPPCLSPSLQPLLSLPPLLSLSKHCVNLDNLARFASLSPLSLPSPIFPSPILLTPPSIIAASPVLLLSQAQQNHPYPFSDNADKCANLRNFDLSNSPLPAASLATPEVVNCRNSESDQMHIRCSINADTAQLRCEIKQSQVLPPECQMPRMRSVKVSKYAAFPT